MAADASLEVPDGSIIHQRGPIEHWSREPGLGLRQRVNPLLRSPMSLPFDSLFRLGSEGSVLGNRVGLEEGGGSLDGAKRSLL